MYHSHSQVAFAASAFEAYGFHEAAARGGAIARHFGIHVERVEAKWAVVAVAFATCVLGLAKGRNFEMAALTSESFVDGDEVFAAVNH